MEVVILKDLETQLVLQSDLIYNKSMIYSNNNQALALTRIARAVFWIATKYRRLANKERAVALFYSKLEKLSVTKNQKFPSDNVADVIVYTLNRYRAFRKKMNIFLSLVAVLSFLIVVSVLVTQNYIFPTLNSTASDDPYPTTATNSQGNVVLPVVGEVTMKDTKTILGDKKIVAFENYHNLSRLLNKKTTLNIVHDKVTYLNRSCVAVTAPNGTVYMVYNTVEKEDGTNTIFTLYRMESDGWIAIGEGEAMASYNMNAVTAEYDASRIYLIADTESNVYIVALLDDFVTIYQYNAQTGNFRKSDANCGIETSGMEFSVYYDKQAGGLGAIYIAFFQQYKFSVMYYDIERDEFALVAEKVGSVEDQGMIMCVQNGTIHVVAQGLTSGKGYLSYYRIEQDGSFEKENLFRSKGTAFTDYASVYNRKLGCGGILIDGMGNIHIIASHFDYDMATGYQRGYLVHYKVDTSGIITKKELPQHYYADTGYAPACASVFMGENGEIYYIESYDDAPNILTICELNPNSCGESECVDVVEIPDNVSWDRIRINEGAVVFYSDLQCILFFKLNFQD